MLTITLFVKSMYKEIFFIDKTDLNSLLISSTIEDIVI